MSRATRVIAARALAHELALEELIPAFGEAGISPLLIRGAATIRLVYDDPYGRDSDDIDLLVPPADHAASVELLERHGFEANLAGPGTPSSRPSRRLCAAPSAAGHDRSSSVTGADLRRRGFDTALCRDHSSCRSVTSTFRSRATAGRRCCSRYMSLHILRRHHGRSRTSDGHARG